MKMIGNECVLDTSIIIQSFKNEITAVQFEAYSRTLVPSIAIGELYYGAYRSANAQKHLDQIHNFLQKSTVISPDLKTADLYGSIKTALKNKGRPIPENDIWIAAMAMQLGLPLFAIDKHFKEIDKIILI